MIELERAMADHDSKVTQSQLEGGAAPKIPLPPHLSDVSVLKADQLKLQERLLTGQVDAPVKKEEKPRNVLFD